MRPTFILTALLLAPLTALHAAVSPLPLVPEKSSVTYAPHPHFKWQREADVKMDDVHRIQIARDAAFAEVVCDHRLEVVSSFVPVKPLLVGLIERPARELLLPFLEKRARTVGTEIEIRHFAPTPLGHQVTIVARVIRTEAKVVDFQFEVRDEHEVVARGLHQRDRKSVV